MGSARSPVAAVFAIAIGVVAPLYAQTPAGDAARPITLVVPIAAGGGMDTIGRTLAERLQERLKQPVVVENRPGAGGVTGVDYAAKAAPDGRTLLLLDISAVLHKWLHKSAVRRDRGFRADCAGRHHSAPPVLSHPSLPVADVKELIAYARANPGKALGRNAWRRSPHHLAAAMLNSAAKIDITHVPYRGTAPALNDSRRPDPVDLGDAQRRHSIRRDRQGGRRLATASAQRTPIPSAGADRRGGERAIPGFDVGVWFAIAAPAKTRPRYRRAPRKEIVEITKLPDVQKRLSPLGYDLRFAGSESLRDLIATDHARYETVIRDAGIEPN